MSQRSLALQHIFVHVDVELKSGHLLDRLSGISRIQTAGRLSIPQWVTGSKLVNRIIGYIEVKSYGLTDGPLSKSPQVAETKKSADELTMMRLIVTVTGFCKGSGVG
jgi:hypothetical protein